MPDSGGRRVRLRYFGRGDYATYFQLERCATVLAEFDATKDDYDINDVLELHHAGQYVERDLFLRGTSETDEAAARAKLPDIRRVVGRFLQSINDSTVTSLVKDVDHQYYDDVLDMLGRSKAYERCSALVMLPALQSAHLHIRNLLGCRSLVKAYDEDVRALLLASPENAEHLVTEHLMHDERRKIVLPASLTPVDRRQLFESYIDSGAANPNYLRLLASAHPNRGAGIDDKLKLKAQKAYAAYWQKHFETTEGIRTGVEVRVDDEQVDAVKVHLDGLVGKYSYSRAWLTENLDFPTILNNFVFLFEFSSSHMLLNFPSFYAQLGVFERYLITVGKDEYRTGAAFNHQQQASMLQTVLYDQILRSQEIDLESVLEWFFTDYLPQEFGAENFKFRPASPSATFLERSRHLFSEMESVLKQFTLYVENGEVDPELLALASEQLNYRDIPSLLGDGKYVYASDAVAMQRIQNLLFSDQSLMGYISEELNESTFAELLQKHEVLYEAFEDHQVDDLDFLIGEGIVRHVDGEPLIFASRAQFAVLEMLNEREGANVQRFPAEAQASIEEMLRKRWLEKGATLLTHAESDYFNFMLNSTYSNGVNLRNRYIHGSQADGEDQQVHFQTYIEVLRLLVALVIKINDDFTLRYPRAEPIDGEGPTAESRNAH